MFTKELKNIIYKIFFITLYLIFGCTFLHMTFDSSFWLVDNGNSGFVGKLVYNLIYNYFPIIDNQYSSFVLVFFTIIFFILGSDINLNKILKTSIFLIKRKEQIMLNYLSQKIFPTIQSKMKYKQNNKVFYLQKKGQELMKKIKISSTFHRSSRKEYFKINA